MKKAITPDEWNKLSEDEKMQRMEKFHEHMEGYRENGIPTGMSDLRRLAIQYGTPIPRLDKNFDVHFEDFKLPLDIKSY